MNVLKSDIFDKWLKRLKDSKAKAIILVHINRMLNNKLGRLRSLGNGIHEKKINYGPGYRLYFINQNKNLIVLLCGGDKSTQKKDIEKAETIAQEIINDLKGKK